MATPSHILWIAYYKLSSYCWKDIQSSLPPFMNHPNSLQAAYRTHHFQWTTEFHPISQILQTPPSDSFQISLANVFMSADIALMILGYIDGLRLISLRRVCKKWRDLISLVHATCLIKTPAHGRHLCVFLPNTVSCECIINDDNCLIYFSRLESLHTGSYRSILNNTGGLTAPLLRLTRLVVNRLFPEEETEEADYNQLDDVAFFHRALISATNLISLQLPFLPREYISSLSHMHNLRTLLVGSCNIDLLTHLTNLQCISAQIGPWTAANHFPRLHTLCLHIPLLDFDHTQEWVNNLTTLPHLRNLVVEAQPENNGIHGVSFTALTQLTSLSVLSFGKSHLRSFWLTQLHQLTLQHDAHYDDGRRARKHPRPSFPHLTYLQLVNISPEMFISKVPMLRVLNLYPEEMDPLQNLHSFVSVTKLCLRSPAAFKFSSISAMTQLRALELPELDAGTCTFRLLTSLGNLRHLYIQSIQKKERSQIEEILHAHLPELSCYTNE